MPLLTLDDGLLAIKNGELVLDDDGAECCCGGEPPVGCPDDCFPCGTFTVSHTGLVVENSGIVFECSCLVSLTYDTPGNCHIEVPGGGFTLRFKTPDGTGNCPPASGGCPAQGPAARRLRSFIVGGPGCVLVEGVPRWSLTMDYRVTPDTLCTGFMSFFIQMRQTAPAGPCPVGVYDEFVGFSDPGGIEWSLLSPGVVTIS